MPRWTVAYYLFLWSISIITIILLNTFCLFFSFSEHNLTFNIFYQFYSTIYIIYFFLLLNFCENLDHYGIIPSSHRQPLHPSKLRSQDRFTTTIAYRDHKFEGRLCTKVSKRGKERPEKRFQRSDIEVRTYLENRSKWEESGLICSCLVNYLRDCVYVYMYVCTCVSVCVCMGESVYEMELFIYRQ